MNPVGSSVSVYSDEELADNGDGLRQRIHFQKDIVDTIYPSSSSSSVGSGSSLELIQNNGVVAVTQAEPSNPSEELAAKKNHKEGPNMDRLNPIEVSIGVISTWEESDEELVHM